MTDLRRRHALMGLGMALTGCTPDQKVVTQSNAAYVSGQKLTRVLIVTRFSRPTLTAGQNASLLSATELKQSFDAKWPPLGIAVEVIDIDGAAANGKPLIAAADARFQSRQGMLLTSGVIKFRGQYVDDYEIDATLYDRGTRDRAIWRAKTDMVDFWRASGMESRRLAAADRYVDDLTAKLKKDGLI
ncbi:MAG: hypothetical protein EPO41_01425 [Reyranella sp.]|uniref:hypothetical protein n=1 Tax=Reyranella sp. TaxID=1929291 RepID=UPI001221AD1D|nr:hypothetical protein [Reyranella sp.]TAJ98142.1 MAG: hypothetical protein EPO41_01425 [Reyranella sp.]